MDEKDLTQSRLADAFPESEFDAHLPPHTPESYRLQILKISQPLPCRYLDQWF